MNTAKSRAPIMVVFCLSLVAAALAPPMAAAKSCSYHVHLFLDLSKSVTAGGSASIYRETLRSLRRMMGGGGAFVNKNYKLLVTPFSSTPKPELITEALGSENIGKLLSSMIDNQPRVDSAQTDLVAVMKSVADEGKNPESHEIVIVASDFAHDVGKGAKEDIADWLSRMNGEDGQSLKDSLERKERFSLLLFVAPALAEDLNRQREVLGWFLKEKIGDAVEIAASRQEFEAVLAARLFPLELRQRYIGSAEKHSSFELVVRNHGCASCAIRAINLYRVTSFPNKIKTGTSSDDFIRSLPVILKPESERSVTMPPIYCPQRSDRYRIELLGEWGDAEANGASSRQEQLNRSIDDFLDCGNVVNVKGQVLNRLGQDLRVSLHLWGQIVDKASSYTLVVVNGQGNEVARRPGLKLPPGINALDGKEIFVDAPLTNGVWTSWSLLADPLFVRLEGEGADPTGARSLMPIKRSWLLLPISPSVLRWVGAPAILWGLTFVLLSCFYRTTPTINNISSVVTLIWASYFFSIFNLAAEMDGDAPLWFMSFRPLISTWVCLWIGVLLSVGFGIPLLWERRSRAAWGAPLEENARELTREISNKIRSSENRGGGSGLKPWSYGFRLLALAGVIALFSMALRSIGAPPADGSSTVKEVRK